jgi:predicted DCC family thiol-disulfide oxidoreductase YuxK
MVGPDSKLTVYYDGLCQLCSREMKYIHGIPRVTEQIEFVDYTEPDFDPKSEGLDPVALDWYFHAKTPDGQMRTGVDAFIELWKVVPRFAWLAWLASKPGFYSLCRLGYWCFAHVRRWLPRRQQSCPLNPKTTV